MKRMGLCSKGPSLPLKKPEELQPDEWTYVKDLDAFYFKLPAGKKLADANIRYPARGSGVIQSITGSWLTVRLLIYPNTIWQGRANHYALASLRLGNTSYTTQTFADFQKATAGEVDSVWSDAATPRDAGADPLSQLKQNADVIHAAWQRLTEYSPRP